jgi:hypothetical protein
MEERDSVVRIIDITVTVRMIASLGVAWARKMRAPFARE